MFIMSISLMDMGLYIRLPFVQLQIYIYKLKLKHYLYTTYLFILLKILRGGYTILLAEANSYGRGISKRLFQPCLIQSFGRLDLNCLFFTIAFWQWLNSQEVVEQWLEFSGIKLFLIRSDISMGFSLLQCKYKSNFRHLV